MHVEVLNGVVHKARCCSTMSALDHTDRVRVKMDKGEDRDERMNLPAKASTVKHAAVIQTPRKEATKDC